MGKRYLLDTNILSQVIKPHANQSYIEHLEILLRQDAELILSPVVYFEVKRGLLRRNARKQLQVFSLFSELMSFIEFDKPVWNLASELWVSAQAAGNSGLSDADILLSAHAMVLDAIVLTCDKGIQRLIPDRYEEWPV